MYDSFASNEYVLLVQIAHSMCVYFYNTEQVHIHTCSAL